MEEHDAEDGRELAKQKEALERGVAREGVFLNLELQRGEDLNPPREEAHNSLAEALPCLRRHRCSAAAPKGGDR